MPQTHTISNWTGMTRTRSAHGRASVGIKEMGPERKGLVEALFCHVTQGLGRQEGQPHFQARGASRTSGYYYKRILGDEKLPSPLSARQKKLFYTIGPTCSSHMFLDYVK